MNLAYAAIIATIALTAVSQLLQKIVAVRRAKSAATSAAAFYLRQPLLYLAIACLVGGMCLWLYALAFVDVGKAYTLLSANYLLVPIFARWFFDERFSSRQWLGAVAMCAGLALVGRS